MTQKRMKPEREMTAAERTALGYGLDLTSGPIEADASGIRFGHHPVSRKNEQEEEDMAQDEEQELVYIPGKRRQEREDYEDEEVENDDPVPLIPNIDARGSRVVHAIRVIKRTPPGEGYKGSIHAGADMEYVGKRWGDGIYDFEAVNTAHKVLRRNPNVKIAMGYAGSDTNGPPNSRMPIFAPNPDSGMASELLKRQAEQHDKDAERASKAAEQAIATAKALSTDYATLIREDSQSRAERDRVYFKEQSNQQNNFFSAILASMQTMHAQTMSMQREGFMQTIQMMQASHQQQANMSNPALLLSLFKEGLRMGQDFGGEESDDPISKVLGAGIAGMGHLKDMMALHKLPNPGTVSGAPPQLPPGPSTQPQKVKPAAPAGKARPKISKEDVKSTIRLKKLAKANGYDFETLLSQAEMMMAGQAQTESEEDEDEEEDESADSPEDSESETGETDLD